VDNIRAKQIMDSDGVIEVLYQGSPVWIENILDNNTAQISDMQSNQKKEVPVYTLVEKNHNSN
jgi:small acid-soluble spore protein H (minor)